MAYVGLRVNYILLTPWRAYYIFCRFKSNNTANTFELIYSELRRYTDDRVYSNSLIHCLEESGEKFSYTYSI